MHPAPDVTFEKKQSNSSFPNIIHEQHHTRKREIRSRKPNANVLKVTAERSFSFKN